MGDLVGSGRPFWRLWGVYNLLAVSRKRRKLMRLIDALVSMAEAVSDPAKAIRVVSKDVKEFLISDGDDIPNSLRQVSKIAKSDQFSEALSRVTEALTVGMLRGYKGEVMGSTGEKGEDFTDRVVDKLFTPVGTGLVSAVVGSFAGNLVLGFYDGCSTVGGGSSNRGTASSQDRFDSSNDRWVSFVCNDKSRELIADCIQKFVGTAVTFYLDKTMNNNFYNEVILPDYRLTSVNTSTKYPVMDVSDVDEEEFGFSRNYFLAKESGSSIKKCNSKISDIGVINEQKLVEAMSKTELKHEKEIKALKDSYKSLYSQWIFELRCGFGLLYYGFGSKRTLLEDFASTSLTDHTVVVINGYLPSINIKQVAMGLVDVLWEVLKAKRKSSSVNSPMWKQPSSSQSMDDIISFLNGPWGEEELFICIVVHNIDGPGLRDSDIQQYLARIAACSHIRIIASIDHVNAPLLWDKKMVDLQFNWFWHHTPTFELFTVEGMFFPLILTNGSSSQGAKSASIVLQSLTPNAQSVFRVLAEHQIAHLDEEGMQISNLYTICRESFLVSSQVTLNSHLTEFKDHDLVKTKRHPDGEDCFHIPLSSEALQKLLQDIS